ncbi:MAG: anthranilate phosphoribosyltransferase [Rhodospirillales bacterium]|jgi:anthranilate phosphoribosyltransferase|nr:anthranilate phosphoribosyltransferase [Rhodospirillales bacterium]MBT5075517.1 anthranilate phosphoribosyltransferase [Rhodospirillales bacterium]MBT5112746.1 anthranilate phosphoribosyltransferase [Rhodospirillales bacterium]MBT5673516.1 anthranilate phosphoribosyltransferase [Rhodospirillales bacterium]MBT6186175.1 anthranilate phosphoribosyltransferase [Rhodospirillales bacterium]
MNAETTNPAFKGFIAQVADGGKLTRAQSEEAFEIIMSGEATPSQMGAFLMALRVRGETIDEITGAATVMRAKALAIKAPDDAIDTCGTGGDASGTYNISTGAAMVVAAAGVPVAKHGNRALSSKSGSADVLAALGVNIDCDMALVEEAISTINVGFLMAPRHHAAMRHVGPTRVELGTRTIFNLLGPLSNPAGTKRQLIGVFQRQWTEPMATVLGQLGTERAWVVHGSDGLDEITTTGATYVSEIKDGHVTNFEITPEDAGLDRADPADLKGGDAKTNAKAITDIYSGEKNAYRDIVVLNAGAALVVANKAPDLKAGVAMASDLIDQGKAAETLAQLVAISNRG